MEKSLEQLLDYCWAADLCYEDFGHYRSKLGIKETVSHYEYLRYCNQKLDEMEKFFEGMD